MTPNATRRAAALALLLGLGHSLAAQELSENGQRAVQLVHEKKYDEAMALLDTCLEKAPRNPILLYYRAVANGQMKKHEQAIVDATAAIAVSKDFARAYSERAYNRLMLNRRESALEDYERAIELEPTNPLVRGELGDLLLELNRLPEAIASYEKAVELAPRWPHAFSQMGRAAFMLTDFAKARASFERAFELFGDDAFSLDYVSRTRLATGDVEGALRSARKLVTLTKSYYAKLALGNLARDVDRYELAEQELAKVIDRSDPAMSVRARLSLGHLMLALGKHERAAEILTPSEKDRAANPSAAPWLLLSRWCAVSALHGMKKASDELQQQLGELADVSPDSQALIERCTAPDAADSTNDTPADPRAACPHLWFAAWRMLLKGDEARAEELMLRCVNTGAADFEQWSAARIVLARRLPHGLAVTPGATIDAKGTVTFVAPDNAAAIQGLRAGDTVTHISGHPFDPKAWQAGTENQRVGHALLLNLVRDGKPRVVKLHLGWQRKPQ